MERDDTVRGLRELADWLEANPEVPVAKVTMSVALTGDDVRAEVARVARVIGSARKDMAGGFYGLKREFVGGAVYDVFAGGRVRAGPDGCSRGRGPGPVGAEGDGLRAGVRVALRPDTGRGRGSGVRYVARAESLEVEDGMREAYQKGRRNGMRELLDRLADTRDPYVAGWIEAYRAALDREWAELDEADR